jgi:NDP-mannose synthase
MKGIVLAGGKGARLAPYTKILPKPLMPIGDMPILEVILLQMKYSGINDIVLTVGHLSQLLHAFFNSGERLGLNISYSYEEKPLGTAGPLSLIKDLNETFLVINGDVLTTLDLSELTEYHKINNAILTIASHQRQEKIDLGVIHFDGSNQVIQYEEKPTLNFMVSMGIYIFEPEVMKYIQPDEYLDFPDLVRKLIMAGEKVVGYPFNGYWQDLGRPADYERASIDFETMRSQFLKEE